MSPSLDGIFRPSSVAVIGASRKRGTVGAEIFHNLLAHNFPGPVYPVHPTARVVNSVRTYPSIGEVPDQVDLAIVVVPAPYVPGVVQECAAKGVKGIVVISAGFGELGPEGKAVQDRMVELVRERGISMVGPNCLGVLSTDPEVPLNATFAPTMPNAGSIAFLSQSGALGVAILDHAHELGVGIRHFISVGNKADVSGNDLLAYWENDPGTKIILMYLEGFGNPRRFVELARRVSRKKPIVVVKSGRTKAGARAASSHTGSLASREVAVEAVLAQTGVIRTNTIEELFNVAMLLANQPVPRGERVGIITNAGGPGIMAADACANCGLQLPALSDKTRARLQEFLPAEASLGNPVDMLASANPGQYEQAIRLLLQDDAIDALIVLFVPPIMIEATAIAEAIRRGAHGADKPVVTSLMGTHGIPAALSSLRQDHFPSYAFPEAAAQALARATAYGRWLEQPEGMIPDLAGIDTDKARAVVQRRTPEDSRWLDPQEVAAVLRAYGIRCPKSAMAETAKEAARIANDIGFPVALKLVSDTITHKTDVGGVLLGLEGEEAVARGFGTIASNLDELGRSSEMAGVLIQQMLPPAVETFVGVTQDPKFGPLLAFGIGGVQVEIWRDIVFRAHPITDIDARQMIEQLRGIKLLGGYRGSPPADRDALIDTLLRVSAMVGDLTHICEMDINPLCALGPGEGVIAADARIRVAARDARDK